MEQAMKKEYRPPFTDRSDRKAQLSFGIVADAHYADEPAQGTRQYRASRLKMAECVACMNAKQVDFLIELGDFKDEGRPASEEKTLAYLQAIEQVFGQFQGPRYHVLGNHDLDSISKAQFQERVANTGIAKERTYYSFDMYGFHFVVLDANYESDGSDFDHGDYNWQDATVPPPQIDWLQQDLVASPQPVIVFIHQQLDVTGSTGVTNSAEVRQVLQASKKVLAVFQGHHHPGHYSYIEGIHYYTLKGMIDGAGAQHNAYALVEVFANHNIVITGYRQAVCQTLVPA